MSRLRTGAVVLAAALATFVEGCDRQDPDSAQGYVEGDFLLIAAEQSGRIAALPVREGTHVDAGALLFRIDDRVEAAMLAGAEERIAQAQAELDDLLRGAGPEDRKGTRLNSST